MFYVCVLGIIMMIMMMIIIIIIIIIIGHCSQDRRTMDISVPTI